MQIFHACADSVYQALFSAHTKEPGDKATFRWHYVNSVICQLMEVAPWPTCLSHDVCNMSLVVLTHLNVISSILILFPFLTGTFEPVRDITLKNTSYTVLVQWSPPNHLPSIPPTNYNITIINTTSAGIIDSDTLTTTNHTFHLDPEHLCSVLLIRIVAYNQWLNGQPGETAWSLGGMVIRRCLQLNNLLVYGCCTTGSYDSHL